MVQKVSLGSIINILVAIMFTITHSCAQYHSIDSLRNVLKTEKEDTNKVNTLNALAEKLWIINSFDSSLANANKAKVLAKKIDFQKGRANADMYIGDVYEYEGIYEEAVEYYTTALSIEQYQGDNRDAIRNSFKMGHIYYVQGNYGKALNYYYNAFYIGEKISDTNDIAIDFGAIGTIYSDEGNYPKALEYFLAMLSFEHEMRDRDSRHVATDLGNIGIIYNQLGNYTKATAYYNKALLLAQQIGDTNDIARNTCKLGSTSIGRKNYKQAKLFLDTAISLSKSIGAKYITREAYYNLTVLDSATGNYKKGLEDYKKYDLYTDDINNEELTLKNTRAKKNYDYEESEEALQQTEEVKQNAFNNEKIRTQKFLIWTSVGLFVFMLLFSLLAFNRNRLKQRNIYQKQLNQKQKEQAIAVMEAQERERKRIAEDLHDSIGHLLSAAMMNIQTISEKQVLKSENSLKLLSQASHELRNITFNLMPRILEEEGLIPALEELVTRITNTGSVNITLHIHNAEKLVIEKQMQFHIYRIIQETVNNILKHAKCTEATIQLIKQDNLLIVMIEDNGKGFDIKEIKKGRGVQNIMSRCEWLDGKLVIDSSPKGGTTITIEIPV